MAKSINSRLLSSALEKYKTKAVHQLRRVTWPRLMESVNKAVEWEMFQLWVRAIGDAAKTEVPGILQEAVERRIPGLLATIQPSMQRALKEGTPGYELASKICDWNRANVFLEAKLERWLDALDYFTTRTMAYRKAWAHWEVVDEEWKQNAPEVWPTYEQWRAAIDAVTTLPNPDSQVQDVLNVILSMPPAQWDQLLSDFKEWSAFGVWLQLVLEFEGPHSSAVSMELKNRYPGFRFSSAALDAKEAFGEFYEWSLPRKLKVPEEVLEALSFTVQDHPEYHAISRYAVHCYQEWSESFPDSVPRFEQWRKSADSFIAVK